MGAAYGVRLCAPDGPSGCRRWHTGTVSRRFLQLSALGAALTANGLRPLPGDNPLSVPSFFGGWLPSEVAPHTLAITIGGTAAHVARRLRRGGLDRDDRIGLALNVAS